MRLAVLALKAVGEADVKVPRVLGVGLAGHLATDGLALRHLWVFALTQQVQSGDVGVFFLEGREGGGVDKGARVRLVEVRDAPRDGFDQVHAVNAPECDAHGGHRHMKRPLPHAGLHDTWQRHTGASGKETGASGGGGDGGRERHAVRTVSVSSK